MSYCQLIEFENGKPNGKHEFENAWGGSARIWNSLYDRYLKDPRKMYDSWLTNVGNAGQLWALADRSDLPIFERAVHCFTFDRFIVRRENFAQMADHLREFVRAYPHGDRVCHLNAWADLIAASSAEAIGLYGSSVGENLWYQQTEDDESIPYDLNTRTEHREVYEYLNAIPAR